MSLVGFYAVPDIADITTPAYWTTNMATGMLSWTTLWLVKASFLSLYWTIFNIAPSFRKAWLFVTSYTCLAFFPVFLAPLWHCGAPWNYADPVTCSSFTVSNTTYYLTVDVMNLVFHISTELLVLALPLVYIGKLQMSKAQKLNAAAIFCLAVITIVLGIISNVSGMCDEDICLDIQLATVVLEAPLVVLVCALPPYKILIAKLQKRKEGLAALPQQNVTGELRAPRKMPMRVVAVQDSITELEMP